MLKRYVVGLASVMAIVALLLVTVAQAQPSGPREGAPGEGLGARLGVEGSGSLRIIKGTIDRIEKGIMVIDVDSILVPREGPMEDVPDSVNIAFAKSDTRFIKSGDRDASLEDFSIGDTVVAITTYSLEDGYALRALLDAQSAVRLREMIGQRFAGERGGRPGMGPDGPGQPGMGPGRPSDVRGRLANRQLPPLLVGTFLGPVDDGASVNLKLTGMLVRQPRPMMRERGEEDEGLGREQDRAADRGKRYHEFPEPREVTVQVAEDSRLFADGEKATLRDFESGDEIVVIIRGRPAVGEGAYLMLMADRESAAKLMKLLVEHARRGQQRGAGERPRESGAF